MNESHVNYVQWFPAAPFPADRWVIPPLLKAALYTEACECVCLCYQLSILYQNLSNRVYLDKDEKYLRVCVCVCVCLSMFILPLIVIRICDSHTLLLTWF